MKKRIAALLAAAVFVVLCVLLSGRERPVLGCRIYADDTLIYESSGTALEDIRVTVDPQTAGIGQLRVEYTAEKDGEAFAFPSIYLDLP